jgi:hypothetical protein
MRILEEVGKALRAQQLSLLRDRAEMSEVAHQPSLGAGFRALRGKARSSAQEGL